MAGASSPNANENLRFLKLLSFLATGQADTLYMIDRVLQMTLLDLNAVSGSLILLDENGSVRDGCVAYNGKTHHTDSWSELVRQGLAGWVIKNREPALIADTLIDPRWVNRAWDNKPASSRSVIAIPLTTNDRIVGVLTLARSAEKKFLENEFYILSEHVMRHLI
jgi:adenylate cyclase